MKAEAWIFVTTTIFFVLVTPAYWLITGDWTGTSALTMTALLVGMVSLYLGFHAARMEPRPEDRKDGEIIEGAGEVGFFPSSSIWPFWAGVTVTLMALGPVFGWWITLLGVGMGIWAVTGWCYQYYRADYQH
jgi:hypothetical protein